MRKASCGCSCPEKRIHINHKRVKLHVPADGLNPEGNDFSIIFDTVENRKQRHQVERGKMIEREKEEEDELRRDTKRKMS